MMETNNKPKRKFFHSLFWKIGGAFLAVLIILGLIYVYISAFTAEMYFQEANQKLNAEVAAHIAGETRFFIDGKVNDETIKSIFHNVMVVNPSIEVYLLDTKGNILMYYAPDKIIKLKRVPLEPIHEFIADGGDSFVMGADPKKEHGEKTFSAAKVFEDGIFRGYIYVILGGEDYEHASQFVFGSYILRLGFRSMLISIIAAALIGLAALAFIIRNIRKIVSVTRRFKNGDLNARINLKSKSELSEFADSFNEMADTIVSNIEEMKTMDNLRRELVANVSHDLRTPLATIQGYVETILIKTESLSDEDRKKYLQTILSSTERLKKLVTELFELSKLEARQTRPKPEPFSIAELIQDVQQKNLIIAEAKNIKLQLDFSYDLPMAYADIGMIEKVLQNLIENALKFTPASGVVNISLKHEKDNILIKVADSGRGIKKDDLPFIFDRYHQGSRVKMKDNEGLGLGLAIVKKILEVHQINISVESDEGKGTSFSFIIPSYKSSVKRQTQLN
ncbi:MAG: HAMP domain-containing sensor histidine kinase [Ignavibacteriaceae bacterium]